MIAFDNKAGSGILHLSRRKTNQPKAETMTTATTTPAETTLAQLGGPGRLKAMIGAKDFMSDDEGRTLRFKFTGSKKANFLKITLVADTYTLAFMKIGRLNKKTYETPVIAVAEIEGVHAEQLAAIIENVTGLYLSL